MNPSALIVIDGSSVRPPTIPTRAQVLAVKDHFQGLMIQSARYGPLPWFTAGLGAMNAIGELDATLTQLLAASDTHCAVDLNFNYGEPGQPWGTPQLVPDCYLENDLGTYCTIIDRVIARGMLPIFVMPSEGQLGLAWTYNNLPRIVAALKSGYDRTRFGPFQYGYDGTWPAAYSVGDMIDFLPWQRSVIGQDAYASMMFANGPAGNPFLWVEDEGDYSKPWMQALDIVFTSTDVSQMQCPSLPNSAQYALGSNLIHTSCSPSFDAPQWIRNAPQGVMSPGTPRGPYGWGPREYLEYDWVRLNVSAADVDICRQRARSIGCAIVG